MKERTKELADTVGAVYPTLVLGRHDGVVFTETELETFVELVAAAEREAIAEMFEASPELISFAQNDQGGCVICGLNPKIAVKAIRARGNT